MTPLEGDAKLHHDCVAALAVCDQQSVICGFTAARVHGLWLPAIGAEIHVAVATPGGFGRHMIRSRRCDVIAHRRQLQDGERAWVSGVAVTSLAVTWFDLAAVLTLPSLVAAGDSALRSGGTRAALAEVVRARSGHRGVRRAREALGLVDARSRSRPESHLRVATAAVDLPRFEVNVPVHRDEGGWLAEPDLSLGAAKIALEYQGEDHGTPQRLRRDLTRAFDLREEGWVVLSYGPAEVFGRPWQITAEIRREVRARRPDLLRGRAPRRHAPRSRTRSAA